MKLKMPEINGRQKMTRLIAVIILAVGISVLGPSPASADILINLGNAAISGYTGPYASVLVTLTGQTATFTFTSLTNSGNIYLLGGEGSLALNLNATSWTLGTFTGSNAGTGFSPGAYSNTGTGNEDGFGLFNQTIKSFDGFSHSADTIVFTVENNSSTQWGTAADVLTPNAGGYEVGAHIFVTSSPANAFNGALATGYAVNGTVPEPATLVFLGMGLVGVAAFGWRKRESGS
jgi:hypothetical protein